MAVAETASFRAARELGRRPGGRPRLAVSSIAERFLAGPLLASFARASPAPHLARGELVAVLEDRCAPFPGLYPCFRGRRHLAPKLSALIEHVRAA